MAIDYTPPLPIRNRLLAALPAADYARLQPQLEPVYLGYQEVIHTPHQPIVHVYFPQDGVVSLVMVMADGTTADVAMMGNDGMVGLAVFCGTETTPTQALSHIAGDALRIPADRFRAEAQQHGPLHDVLRCYTQSFMTQIAQVAACHRLHTLTAQYARWLLMTSVIGWALGRFRSPRRFLAQLQGVRRARIEDGTGRRFRRAELIHYTRGTLAILDRPGLEAIACECYGIIGAGVYPLARLKGQRGWKLLGALDHFRLVVAPDAEADFQLHLKLAHLPCIEEPSYLRALKPIHALEGLARPVRGRSGSPLPWYSQTHPPAR